MANDSVALAEAPVQVAGLTHRYGRRVALENVDLSVPEGSLFAALGPNGAGKSTLLRIVAGLQRPGSGRVAVLGHDPRRLPLALRARIGYVAEGLGPPGWMRLNELERWLRPLHPGWDTTLADQLRERFDLDPGQQLRTLSRGEAMKAALLCALAPRPRLLVLDEPFAGMDVAVRDELVRGLLETSGSEGWTVVLASHEISEIEGLVDRVVFLARGRIHLDGALDEILGRYRRIEVMLPADADPDAVIAPPPGALTVERAGRRLVFIVPRTEREDPTVALSAVFPEGSRLEDRNVTLRELFVSLTTATRRETSREAGRR